MVTGQVRARRQSTLLLQRLGPIWGICFRVRVLAGATALAGRQRWIVEVCCGIRLLLRQGREG